MILFFLLRYSPPLQKNIFSFSKYFPPFSLLLIFSLAIISLLPTSCAHKKHIYPEVTISLLWAGRGLQLWPRLKSAPRPPPCAQAESANFRLFYVKKADFSPPPPATKKRRKLVQTRPRCLHLATTKRRKVVKIRPCGEWWVDGPPPLFFFNLITVKWS